MGDGRREESTYYKTKKIDSDLPPSSAIQVILVNDLHPPSRMRLDIVIVLRKEVMQGVHVLDHRRL